MNDQENNPLRGEKPFCDQSDLLRDLKWAQDPPIGQDKTRGRFDAPTLA